jgi:Fungal Zn(2)-Cys(6) binuclear cluster domain
MCPDAADPIDGGAGSQDKTSPPTSGLLIDNVEHHSPQDSLDLSPSAHEHDEDGSKPSAVPLQKRRRVTRACDECRRKKIKCDGKQPCTHCTVYSYGKWIVSYF